MGGVGNCEYYIVGVVLKAIERAGLIIFTGWRRRWWISIQTKSCDRKIPSQ